MCGADDRHSARGCLDDRNRRAAFRITIERCDTWREKDLVAVKLLEKALMTLVAKESRLIRKAGQSHLIQDLPLLTLFPVTPSRIADDRNFDVRKGLVEQA